MDSDEECEYAFAVPDLWRVTNSAAFQDETTPRPASCWAFTKIGLDLGLDAPGEKEGLLGWFDELNFSLPHLVQLESTPLEDLEAQESFPPSLTDDSVDESEPLIEFSDLTEDIWSCPEVVSHLNTRREFKSWEVFNDSGFNEPQPVFISERGSIAVDAAVIAYVTASNDQSRAKYGRILHSGPLLMGLSLLGLGRESILFRYMESEQTFQARIEDGRMSGYTTESFASLTADFVHHGNKVRRIEKFIDSVYSTTNSVRPLVSLANAFSTIMSALQWESGEKLKLAGGLLQLQSLLQGPGLVLSYISEMKETVSDAESDHELLSKVYRFLQDMEHKELGLRQIGSQLLARISEPWLMSLSRWLGLPSVLKELPNGAPYGNKLLCQDNRTLSQQGKISDSSHKIQHDFGASSIPGFISEEDAKIISGVGQGLQVIRSHKPEHPLARPDKFDSGNPVIPTWQFSWQDADRIVLQAKEYERRVAETIRKYHTSNGYQNHPDMGSTSCQSSKADMPDWSTKDFQAEIEASIAAMEEPLHGSPPGNLGLDSLPQTVMNYINSKHETAEAASATFAPPLSLVPVLSFNPIIYAQSRLVNHACLRLLFKEHKLRFHLSVLHGSSLFGDGLFATRLSHALFNPELQSTQRRKGHSRSGVGGLRLGYRDSWPPAVSELCLALMGILADRFHLDDHRERLSGFDPRLPGDLNFAIRNIPEHELKRCNDPHSVHALDFLQLKYRPPAPLEIVLTPSCLDKYDHIFKHLLRGTRMIYVVNQFSRMPLDRSSNKRRSNAIKQRFRFEAHHIVTTTCGYFFDGIRLNWAIFQHKLDAIETHLDDFNRGDEHGLEKLRAFHEMVLDRIMLALFLRTRQTQLANLLLEIFSCVLLFARLLNNNNNTTTTTSNPPPQTTQPQSQPQPQTQPQPQPQPQTQNRNKTINDDPAAQELEDLYARFQTKVRRFVTLCRDMSEQQRSVGVGVGVGAAGIEELEFGKEEDRGGDDNNTMAQLVLRLDMNGYYYSSS